MKSRLTRLAYSLAALAALAAALGAGLRINWHRAPLVRRRGACDKGSPGPPGLQPGRPGGPRGRARRRHQVAL